MTPKADCAKTQEIMFETFNAPALCQLEQGLAAIYSCGTTTGIAVDSCGGDTSCTRLDWNLPRSRCVKNRNQWGLVMTPKADCAKTQEIMFETFNAPALCQLEQGLAAIYSCGTTTGIAVDSCGGDTSCTRLDWNLPRSRCVKNRNQWGLVNGLCYEAFK